MASNPNFPVDTASVSWFESDTVHIRVYSSDGYDAIERCWDGSGWYTGGFKAPGNQVTATCWQQPGGIYIRVYCTAADKTVEYCWDAGQGWYTGAYTTQ